MISTFIFDWSGTLSDDFDMVYSATASVIHRLDDGHALSEEEYRQHFELPYMNFYRNYGLKCTKAQVDELFFQAVEKNGIFPTPLQGSRELLEGLRKQGKKTYLFSAHPVHLVDREVAAFGYGPLFDGIEAGIVDKVASLKSFVKQNGLEPKKTAYVGDLVHDVEAAKAAGIQSIAVFSRYQEKAKLEKAKPDVIAGKLEELLTL
ncbi:HAD family hydrolase [Candidatus Micrarchaeota archaeon]|nr:HAD family hydrolase [Candidatus Micrarchaeota archaeon]